MTVTVHAPAKINLTLDVVGRRSDGYHLLESIMQTVDRYDTLTAVPTDRGITLTLPGMPDGAVCPTEKNTAYRAAQLFLREGGFAGGVAMTLHKRIPQQAGMGGGSADAAAALWALDRLYHTRLSAEELCRLGVRIGADVPFCVMGGTAYVTGIGEEIEPLSPLPDCVIAVSQPREGVSTAAAYAALDGTPITRRPDHRQALAALRGGDLPGLCGQVINVFEPAVALPGVAAIRQTMERFSPLASRMTGSGSAVFAVFAPDAAVDAAACLRALEAEEQPTAFLCRPCAGCIIEETE